MSIARFRIGHLVFLTAFAALLTATGCSKEKKADESATPSGAAAADDNVLGDSDSGKAMGLQTVHFGFDSFVLDSTAKSVLKANADVLKDRPTLKVQIEGHCDQRGGIQYNIALGEKRSNAARKYLMDLGIDGDRVTTISYGKERPLDPAETEEAYAKNRRGNFVVTSR